ncbi:transketolase family protein [Terasakiella pusilla]|uniref:transketolase family protein n=1 Tax=Terasakiella pusilla TaxID=64973 RepID=UPI003AA84552
MMTKPIAMRDALLEQIHQAMAEDDKIFFLSADFGSPVLDRIRADFPARFLNVGIAEQNLINVASGLGLEGYKVFAYAIAPFITMRCFEQIRVNLALLSVVRPMNVNLIGVGAGMSYVVSGPTHQCYEDLSLIRSLPNVELYSPSDHVTSAALSKVCLERQSIKYLRLDAQVLPKIYADEILDVSAGYNVLRSGNGVCLVATGYMVHKALKVADYFKERGQEIGVIDLHCLTGFDERELTNHLANYKDVFSMEEGFRYRGGLDARLQEMMENQNFSIRFNSIGVEASYRYELGSREDLHAHSGIGEKDIIFKVDQKLKNK